MPPVLLRICGRINHFLIWQVKDRTQALWLIDRYYPVRRKPSAMNPNLTVATLFATAVFVAAASYSNLSFGGFVAPSNAREDNAAMAKAAIELKNTLAGKNRVMLVAVKSAKVTEISGKSFHFCLAVADNSVRFDVKAAVYRDISGRLFLLEWKPNGC